MVEEKQKNQYPFRVTFPSVGKKFKFQTAVFYDTEDIKAVDMAHNIFGGDKALYKAELLTKNLN